MRIEQCIALTLLSLFSVAVHGQIATYDSIVGLAASYNEDDKQRVIIIATADGNLHEMFYDASAQQAPRAVGQSVIGHFVDIVGIAAFYNHDDGYRIALVATKDGKVHELFYHPNRGRGESVIAELPGIVALAGFYTLDDNYRIALVATQDGKIHEVFYNPNKGRGETVVAQYSDVVSIAGTFVKATKYRCLLAVSRDGTVHQLFYHPTKPRNESILIQGPGSIYPVKSVALNDNTLVVNRGSGLLHQRIAMTANSVQVTASSYSSISALDNVAIDVFDDGNIVYNLGGNVFRLGYDPFPPTPPATQISSFSAAPNNGYINVGEAAALSWTVSFCGSNCQISLQGKDGPSYSNPVLNASKLPTQGTFKVTPKNTLTQYTLTASGTGGSDASSRVVQLYASGPACSGCAWFYFKMTSGSVVTPCFTVAQYAKDENTAMQIAESQNGGYSAQAISYAQFVAGCQ
jgi:hypothetical protein